MKKEQLFQTIVSERSQIQQLRLVVYRLAVLAEVEKERQVLYAVMVGDLLQEMIQETRGVFGLSLVERDGALTVETRVLSLNPGNWAPGTPAIGERPGFETEMVEEKMVHLSVASGSLTDLPDSDRLTDWNQEIANLMDFHRSSGEKIPSHTVLNDVPVREYSDHQLQNLQDQLDEANEAVFRLLDQLDKKNRELARARREASSSKEVAREADQARKEFLYQMSHDIRTPLNAIIGMVDLLAESDLTPEQQHYVEVFEQASENLLDLVNDLFDLSRIEAGVIEVSPDLVDLRDLVDRVLTMFRDRADEKGLELNATFDSSCPDRVMADPRYLEQILVNLVRNAVDNTGDGHVDVRVCEVSETRDRMLLSWEITDTGQGMSREQQSHAFDSFKGRGKLHSSGSGHELGLSITRRLVELMDGSIELESMPGQGRTFRFQIPVQSTGDPDTIEEDEPATDAEEAGTMTEEGADSASDGAGDTGGALSGPPVHLLVAEDNDVNRRVVEMYLKDEPVEIDFATNGDEALEAFQAGGYDLVFIDLRMPVMDGIEATMNMREMESNDGRERTPIIALTAEAREEQKRASARAGCDAHIVKPVSRKKLTRVLVRHLERDGGERTVEMENETGTESEESGGDLDVSEEFQDLVPEFVSEARGDLQSMETALENGDSESLSDLAHKMKGAAGFYEFDRIVKWSREIEEALEEEDHDIISERIEQLSDRIDRIERKLT